MGKIVKWLFYLILVYILFFIISVVIPPLFQKGVSGEYKKSLSKSLETEPKCDTERILCIDDNTDAMVWRLRVIESAEDEIILSTFDFGDDKSGREIMSALLSAADRGVDVKILVDGINGFLKLQGSDYFKALTSDENVEVKFYNPINFLMPWKLNYRMHDKYLIADNDVYILGGRNTNNLFLGNYSKRYNVDRDILVYENSDDKDSSLNQVRDYFEEVWSLPECKKQSGNGNGKKVKAAAKELGKIYEELDERYPDVYKDTDWAKETVPAKSVTLLTNPVQPQNKSPWLWYSACKLMEQGKDIVIQTPYIICNKRMYSDLSGLCVSDRNISIMTNAVNNGANPWGCVDYLNQKDNILETGVEMLEYLEGHSLHTKTILIDDDISIVGSFNIDMRSVYLDTEMMLFIDCPELNSMLRETADESAKYCKLFRGDGTQMQGEKYKDVKLPKNKRIFYNILRKILIPFRHLL